MCLLRINMQTPKIFNLLYLQNKQQFKIDKRTKIMSFQETILMKLKKSTDSFNEGPRDSQSIYM